jgi:hypothetical protein
MSNDLILSYKGKTVVLLTEAEIINNNFAALINTGHLVWQLGDAMRELKVLADMYHPEEVG